MKLLLALLFCLPCTGFAADSADLVIKNAEHLSVSDAVKPDLSAAPVENRQVPASSVFEYLSSLGQQDAGAVSVVRSGNSIVIARLSGRSAYSEAYKYGDVVFLTGHLEDDWTQQEWTRYYGVAKWLVQNGFRVVMNPVAMPKDIKAAVQDDSTKVIIWSSHGSESGGIYDSAKNLVPEDAFLAAGRNFKQLIVSSCYSDVMAERYKFPQGLSVVHWTGTTGSDELFDYLTSKRWDPRSFGANVE